MSRSPPRSWGRQMHWPAGLLLGGVYPLGHSLSGQQARSRWIWEIACSHPNRPPCARIHSFRGRLSPCGLCASARCALLCGALVLWMELWALSVSRCPWSLFRQSLSSMPCAQRKWSLLGFTFARARSSLVTAHHSPFGSSLLDRSHAPLAVAATWTPGEGRALCSTVLLFPTLHTYGSAQLINPYSKRLTTTTSKLEPPETEL